MKEKDQKLFKESKRLFMETMTKYIKYFVPIFLLLIGILIITYFFNSSSYMYFAWIAVISSAFITFTYLVIFDGGPARKIKKDKYVGPNMSKNQGIVFYNALRLRTIFRGMLNIIGTGIITGLAITLLYI